MEDLITIIVPIYNVEKYLRECIESICRQTYRNIEIILINDGSNDNSAKICDEYKEKDSRIKVIHKENGGVSSARNKGLEIAKGAYITFVDGDDYIDEKYCEKLLKNLKENNVECVLCGFNRIYEKTAEVVTKGENLLLDKNKSEKKLLKDSKQYLKYKIGADGTESVAHTLELIDEGYDGVIHIKPFGCTPEINAMPILKKISDDYSFPIMFYTFDTLNSDTGFQTRVEAFIDMLEMRKK